MCLQTHYRCCLHPFPNRPNADTVWTFGQLSLSPGAASIIPGHARLTLQFRDPDDGVLDKLEAVLYELVAETNGSNGNRSAGVWCELHIDRQATVLPMYAYSMKGSLLTVLSPRGPLQLEMAAFLFGIHLSTG